MFCSGTKSQSTLKIKRDFFQNPPQPHENYYDIFKLPYGFDFSTSEQLDALTKAYDALALYHHPIHNKDREDEARKIFELLNRAYKTLMSTAKRAEYNRENLILVDVKETAAATVAAIATDDTEAADKKIPSPKSIHIEIDPIDLMKFKTAMNYRRPVTGLLGGMFSRQEIPDLGAARQQLTQIVDNLAIGTLDERLQQYFSLFNIIKSLEGNSALEPVFHLLKGSFGSTRYEILSYIKTKKRDQGSDLTLSIFSAIFPHIHHDTKYNYDSHFTSSLFAFIDADLLDLPIIRAAYDKRGETLAFRDLIRAIMQIADIQNNPALRIECKNFFYLKPHRAATLAGPGIVGNYASSVSPELQTYYLIAILKAPLSVQIIKTVFNNSALKSAVVDFEMKLSEVPQRAIFTHAILKGASDKNKEAALQIATELMAMSDRDDMRKTTLKFLREQHTFESASVLKVLDNLLDAAYCDTGVETSTQDIRAAAR